MNELMNAYRALLNDTDRVKPTYSENTLSQGRLGHRKSHMEQPPTWTAGE